jgi:chemotaxis protein CheZ
MAKRLKFDESGDSDDLQALFDSIAGGPPAPAPRPISKWFRRPSAGGDDDDLQALFDSVASEYAEAETEAVEPGGAPTMPQGVQPDRRDDPSAPRHPAGARLRPQPPGGRPRHPDARQRLSYIAEMTEQAASKVLNATDIAKPIQDKLQPAPSPARRWDRLYANQLSPDEFRALAGETREFLGGGQRQRETNAQLLEIMMAQDFQDLTGQVIKKVVDLAQGLEQQLLQVLLEAMPAERKTEASESLMNGPVISAVGRDDGVQPGTGGRPAGEPGLLTRGSGPARKERMQ